MRHWRALSLSEGASLGIPSLEEPGPEGARATEVPLDSRPELANFTRRHEGEDIVWLRLPHHLPHKVRANVGIGVSQSLLELLESQVAIPEEVGTSLQVEELLSGSWIERHALSVAPALRSPLGELRPSGERADLHSIAPYRSSRRERCAGS